MKYLRWITTKDMEFFRVKKDIPFMKYSKISAVISTTVFILAVIFIVIAQLFNNSTWNSKPDVKFQLSGHIIA